MRKIEILIKENKKLKEKEINSLIELKKQYWIYEEEEQKKWIQRNLLPDDFHVFIWESAGELLAYLDIVLVSANVNNKEIEMLGIGNVCVHYNYREKGYGSILMAIVNAFVKEERKYGILLCKNNLVNFYKKADWKEINPAEISIMGKPYNYKVMIYDPYNKLYGIEIKNLMLKRNF